MWRLRVTNGPRTRNGDSYKTTDGGKSWEKILYKGPESGVNDLVMDPRDPDILYATIWQRTRLKWNDPRTYEIIKTMGSGKPPMEVKNGNN